MWEPASSSSVPVPTPYVELSHFWCPWVSSTLQHPPYQEENPGSGLAVGAVAESWLSLNFPSLVVLGVSDYLPPGLEVSPHLRGSPAGGVEMESQTMWQGSGYLRSSGLYYFLPGPSTHNKWPYLEFQPTATNFVSMAATLSDLVDKTSGANLHTEGHVDVPTQGAKDPWEPEEGDSSPTTHCLGLWPRGHHWVSLIWNNI